MFLVVRHLDVCYNAIAGRYHKNRTKNARNKVRYDNDVSA